MQDGYNAERPILTTLTAAGSLAFYPNLFVCLFHAELFASVLLEILADASVDDGESRVKYL